MALTGKQRSHLRGLAHHVDPVVLTGAAGVTDAILSKTHEELDNHELIKVKIADGPQEIAEAAQLLVEGTASELVQVIGRMVVLYRRRKKDPTIKLPPAG